MAQQSVNINDERSVRLAKLEALKADGINPYPARAHRKDTVAEALEKKEGAKVAIAGRIMTKRALGKLVFCHVQDESGKMQVVLKKDQLSEELFKLFEKKIDIGDICLFEGERFITKKGEESVLATSWTLFAKALLPLPDKFHGLQDEEIRFRKRYLDFLLNEKQRNHIRVRANVLKAFREFLDKENYTEAETPILENIASGAMATSFETHLNAFDLDVHLRITSGELWLKRLMVAGFEKVYEMGRAFRNEGVDREHNPEFTMLEYYWAYADHFDNMKLYERMIPYVVEKATGKLQVEHKGEVLDFTPPYDVISFHDAVLNESGIDLDAYRDTASLAKVMAEKGYEVDESAERGKLMDNLFKQTARKKIIQPTFVTDYPTELKPLTKRSEENPDYTEMNQFLVHGYEIGNNYTELNDPVDQKERLLQQADLKAGGEEESMAYDHEFIEALEYGMPPSTGTGIGIDRLVTLLTDAHSLREVIAFPLMKPKETDQ